MECPYCNKKTGFNAILFQPLEKIICVPSPDNTKIFVGETEEYEDVEDSVIFQCIECGFSRVLIGQEFQVPDVFFLDEAHPDA